MSEHLLLTVTAAAKRVKRSRRQIETWIAEGLPVIWISNVRHIRINLLLDELRRRNAANPSTTWHVGKNERSARRVQRNLERKHAKPDAPTES